MTPSFILYPDDTCAIPPFKFYFEGTMSFEPVFIGAGSNAGARSVLLGGGTIRPGGSLETLGLVAKSGGVRRGSSPSNRGALSDRLKQAD